MNETLNLIITGAGILVATLALVGIAVAAFEADSRYTGSDTEDWEGRV